TKVVNNGGSFELNVPSEESFKNVVRKRLNNPATFVFDVKLADDLASMIQQHPERWFFIVVAPYHESYLSTYKGRERFDRYCKNLESFNNVAYLDFSKLKLPQECFYNTTHINYKGAVRFSTMLKDS